MLLSPADREHGDIVRLRGASSEGQKVVGEAIDHFTAREKHVVLKAGGEAFVSEFFLRGVVGFRHAIRIEKDRVAGHKLLATACIPHVAEEPKGNTAGLGNRFHGAGGAQQIGRIMTGTTVAKLAGAGVQDAVEAGGE